MPISDWPPSVGGLAVIATPRSSSRLTSSGSSGAKVWKARAVGVGAGDLLAGDDDVADLALVDLGQELRIGDVVAGGALSGVLEQIEERDQDQPDDHPQGEITEIRVHRVPFDAPPEATAPRPATPMTG